MLMVQCELGRQNTRMITWLPQDKRVKVGSVISLDRQPERWKVLSQGELLDSANIKRGWNNNI